MTSLKADASPTKAFFVRMLTRDISLDDCILDLVDNSIDGAWEVTGETPSELEVDDALGRFYIDILIGPDFFSIADNCGGITLDEAEKYAFTFGRKEQEPQAEYSVGVYGIGMKRAAFKMGRKIRVESTYEVAGGEFATFVVPINVDLWARNEDDWDFDIEQVLPSDQAGVRIEIRNLSSEARHSFEDPSFERSLRLTLARDYLLPLMRGLRITVNGTPVTSQKLVFQQSTDFAPMRHKYNDDSVTVEIIAGMWTAPPDDNEPEEANKADRTSGWYILCNGRAVLAADRSAVTGWGFAGRPTWHGQYKGFLGFVLFSASDPADLPMTTTKRSVNISSGVYLRALAAMERPARAWIDYTNARKAERDAAKVLERRGEPVALSQVKRSPTVRLPTLNPGPPREPTANVLYAVPRKRLRKLAAALGNINMTQREVGLKSFDYAYEMLVEEDD